MPDNTFRVQGEKLARALDEHIGREYSETSQALEVRLAVAEYFNRATSSAIAPRRPFPTADRPVDAAPGDWN